MAKYRPWAGARIWPKYGYLGHIRGRPNTGDIGYLPVYGPVQGIWAYIGYTGHIQGYTVYRPISRVGPYTGYTAVQAISRVQAHIPVYRLYTAIPRIRPRLHTPYIPCTGLCTVYGPVQGIQACVQAYIQG